MPPVIKTCSWWPFTPPLFPHSHYAFPLFLVTYSWFAALYFSLAFSALIHAPENWPLQTGHPCSPVFDLWLDSASGRHGQEIRGRKEKRLCVSAPLYTVCICTTVGCIPEHNPFWSPCSMDLAFSGFWQHHSLHLPLQV